MATVIFNEVTLIIPDGSVLSECLEEAGYPLTCQNEDSACCKVEVIDGAGYLSPLTEKERRLNLPENIRLACEVTIYSGIVKLISELHVATAVQELCASV